MSQNPGNSRPRWPRFGEHFKLTTDSTYDWREVGERVRSFEDALRDGGFDPAIAGSGEEAITLLRGFRSKYRALVPDIILLGRIDGWRVARVAEAQPVRNRS